MHNFTKHSFLLCFAALLSAVSWASSPEWEFVKEVDDVKVMQRDVAGSPYKEIMGTMATSAELLPILLVLRDVESCSQWLHKCLRGELIEKISPTEALNYTVVKGPLIIKDRETYVHSTVNYDPAGGRIYIKMNGVNEAVPPRKKPVRVLDFEGFWDLQRQTDGTILMRYQIHSNPQTKAIKATNSTLVASVFETLKNVSQLAQSDAYENKLIDPDELQALIKVSAENSTTVPTSFD